VSLIRRTDAYDLRIVKQYPCNHAGCLESIYEFLGQGSILHLVPKTRTSDLGVVISHRTNVNFRACIMPSVS
jgi:hypothetical protein